MEARAAKFEEALGSMLFQGFQVQSRAGYQATLVRPGSAPVNHVLHVILTIFLCGLWAPVWLVLAITAKPPQTQHVTVDERGLAWIAAPGQHWRQMN